MKKSKLISSLIYTTTKLCVVSFCVFSKLRRCWISTNFHWPSLYFRISDVLDTNIFWIFLFFKTMAGILFRIASCYAWEFPFLEIRNNTLLFSTSFLIFEFCFNSIWTTKSKLWFSIETMYISKIGFKAMKILLN